ncbi:MAG TPA: AAA family ATPase [Acidimicrobiales bacterium]|jgi:DNA repair protein RecN (Recombination protein N)|nr:AAA family ATPase [Acidimicrobiales bacterium]
MLETLRVRNFGAVDEAVIEFEPGLTVLTGETGAGKTLLVEALHLVLGGADRGLPVRHPELPSLAEAVFSEDVGEVVLARERSAHGRLRAMLDGATASAQALATRAGELCELHGQHEHQVLRRPGAPRVLLDRTGGLDDTTVQRLRAERRELVALRERLGGETVGRARRLEIAIHDRDEIDDLAPTSPDEIEALQMDASGLAELVEARDALAAAAGALDADGDEPSAAQLVGSALSVLPRTLESARESLTGLLERVREVRGELLASLGRVVDDPERLAVLDQRIGRLRDLVRKHGGTLGDVLDRRTALDSEIEQLQADEATAVELEGRLVTLETALRAEEDSLLDARRRAAAALTLSVQDRLGALALAHARFEVRVEGTAGEEVLFLFAGSGAFEPAPLADVASGGELSRVMLALTLASPSRASCLVFDEVDAGVGGTTARTLAQCLAELATDHQVIVVTHLASVAAAAMHQIVVTRSDARGEPASIRQLDGEDRVPEIARMLAGDSTDPVAIAHASGLLAGDSAFE